MAGNSDSNISTQTREPLRENLLSEDRRLNKLLESVIKEVKLYAEDQLKHMRKLAQIGISLSSEKDINKLLEGIVDEARALSNADAGTLYTLDHTNQELRFAIMQSESMQTRMGGASGIEINFPGVPLYKDGKPNLSNVSSYVALKEETVNIPDVYEAEGFDFTGPRNYDAATGYRSKSMLVIPLKNHENDIIGVLQLLNAQDADKKNVIPFSTEYVDLIASLASQAAITLTNAQLIQNLQNLLNSFIRSIATAIDEKSPYTGGHINRVVDLTMMLAEKINAQKKGVYKDVCFNEDEMEELRMAAWMHDVGKITTPESVVDKASKLQTVFDLIHLIEIRFALIARNIETEHFKNKLKQIKKGAPVDDKALERKLARALNDLNKDLDFIRLSNTPGEFMSEEKIKRLKKIAQKTYMIDGQKRPYLTDYEFHNLSIRKGSLTEKERGIIEYHTVMTKKILSNLPFPKRLSRVPEYAAAHHEKLDGSGYPEKLTKEALPLQARIMAIADVFEALTAPDRPYKKPMTLSQAVKIMELMKNDNHIDPDLFELFVKSGIYYDYALKEMNPEQIDESRKSVKKTK